MRMRIARVRLGRGLWLLLFGLMPVLALGALPAAAGAPDRLISAAGVGPVRLGMTIGAARAALAGFTLARTADAEGAALIAVLQDGEPVMRLYAGEDDPAAPIDATATLIAIDVTDPSYRTAADIGPQSPLSEVERAYGHLVRIRRSEIEQREYAEFDNQPNGLVFRVDGGAGGGEAGLYLPGTDMTGRFRAGARVLSITVQRLP